MIRRLALAFALCAALVGAATRADAARRRVVLVQPGPTLVHSVGVALSTWDIDVVASDASLPGADIPDAEPRAEALATSSGADAVAWVAEAHEGAVLFVYDAATKQVTSRVLDTRPPFDDVRAAAVALSLKTLLRTSVVAPEPERFGATPPTPPPPPPDVLHVELLALARIGPADAREPRFSAGAVFWPRWEHAPFGVAVNVAFGTGANVDDPFFNGTFEDFSLSPSLRSRIALAPRLFVEPALGPTFHFTEIEGTAIVPGTPIELDKLDTSLDAALTGEYKVGFFSVGIRASAGYFLRYQSYTVQGHTILSLSPWMGDVGLRLSMGVL